MSEREHDIIVVGSGASAVHAAWPLVDAGLSVGTVDVGHRDEEYEADIPSQDFVTLRRTDPEQHRYLLGKSFEGIPFGPVRVGAQLTPPRQFITRQSDALSPHKADSFAAMQSFALGGLGAGWGASTMPFTDDDLTDWPLSRDELQPHYDTVAARIGISGRNDDDIEPFVGPINGMMTPARIDTNARTILGRYSGERTWCNAHGLYMGYPRLAMATEPFGGRGPAKYTDMEFWSDHEKAVYRPRYTLDTLRERENFIYYGKTLALRFEEIESGILVHCRNVEDGHPITFKCRRLVLAAGAIGSARITARSLNLFDKPLPFVSNPYTYFPCINLPLLGRPIRDRRHSLTQLTMIYDPDGTGTNLLQPQMYSYRSLLLFKLLKESPLPYRESLRLMRLLQEYFVIVGVFHPDQPTRKKLIVLRRSENETGDVLEFHYRLSQAEERRQHEAEKSLRKILRKLSCLPLKTIRPGHGSSIHYAGSFPMRSKGGRLTTTSAGELRASPRVILADGASFPNLPAKGLTFTLMANANRVGTLLAQSLSHEGQ